MSTPQPPQVQIFVSYSHKDQEYLNELKTHLTPSIREKKFTVWYDEEIKTGERWEDKIKEAINASSIAILLISASFLASRYIAETEIPSLLKAAKEQKIKIFSVILSPSGFEESELKNFQTINSPSKPLINMSPGKQQETWVKLTREIAATISAPGFGTSGSQPPQTGSRRRPTIPVPNSQNILKSRWWLLVSTSLKSRWWLLVLALILVVALLGVYFVVHVPPPIHPTTGHGTPTATFMPSPLPSPTATAVHFDSDSSLIPPGQQPVINDTLKDNSQGYKWDVENDATGTCGFAQGQYVLTSPANSDGVGCTTNSTSSVFGNFVYQIRMTIRQGLDDTANSGVGPIFRVNTDGSGQQYQVTFDVNGDWDVSTDQSDLTPIGAKCANPCPYFHSGLNQANFITIRAAGSSIQVQINGYTLASYTDSMYSSGYIGVQLTPGKDAGSVAFSALRVWKL